ncbi:MAG: methylmalonyl-CoA epimerase [Bacteroidia bacterium]|nr:methylmalonyl-CoA epimerase [Bacteroidia bacterium]MCO5253479.1 methylmalonyl-CoA epimerase [Bacteroidota bacterium]MCZ2131316.1 methylmalonyl-CoA epimerase [Bacteroidia bacterium]
MKRIEHIGIAVKDIEAAIPVYENLLNTSCYKIEDVATQGVKTAFFKIGENKIELLAATRPDSPIAKFIEKNGEGIHHYAFLVDDIQAEIERLKSEGFVLINEQPVPGADNMEIAFLHPKSTLGNLIELCQPKK